MSVFRSESRIINMSERKKLRQRKRDNDKFIATNTRRVRKVR